MILVLQYLFIILLVQKILFPQARLETQCTFSNVYMEIMYGICGSINYKYVNYSNKKLPKKKKNDGNGNATIYTNAEDLSSISSIISCSWWYLSTSWNHAIELGIFGAYLWYVILSWYPFFKLKCHWFGTKIIKHIFHGLFA